MTTAPRALSTTEQAAEEDWLRHAIPAVDRSIDRLVDTFVEYPLRHRVEHSLHADLMALLLGEVALSGTVSLSEGWRTQLVHKEWPEAMPRPSKRNRRGHVDIAVLSPVRLAGATAKQFQEGRVIPPIAIELGLNYDREHLRQDEAKMRNSRVEHPYLVHLSHRLTARDPDVETFDGQALASAGSNSRFAYAHVDVTRRVAFLRHLDDRQVQRRDVVP